MFDLGWWELAIVGLLMILILGPKELPNAMRAIAKFLRKARRLAAEFQGHIDDLMRESELADVKKTVQNISQKDIGREIEKVVDPTGEFSAEIDSALTTARDEVEELEKIGKANLVDSTSVPPQATVSSGSATDSSEDKTTVPKKKTAVPKKKTPVPKKKDAG